MATGVTYDGVESTEGGNIFQGLSFWVAQRVPMRNDILSKIKSNGGTVVPLEKNAKFLIADYVRKDAPPGSFSWKFITDSVQHGALQVEDRYRIGPDPNMPRPAGGGRLTRAGRVAFTPADKATLAKWVLSKPAARRQGNELYMELEKLNTRHTWQSWRNHWINTLQKLDDHQLKVLAATAPDEHASQGTPHETAEEVASKTTALPDHLAVPQRPVHAAPPQRARVNFSNKDDAIIAQWALLHSLEADTSVFKALEQEHPHHSWDSWRTRWNKKLRYYSLEKLQEMADTLEEELATSSAPVAANPKAGKCGIATRPTSERTTPGQGESRHNTPTTLQTHATKIRPATEVAAKQPVLSPPAGVTSKKTQSGPFDVDTRSSEEGRKTHQRQPSIEPLRGEGAPGIERKRSTDQADEEEDVTAESEDVETDDDPQRDQFYRDLISFNDCEPEEFDWPVLQGPTGKHEIDLYELAQAYDAQRAALEDINWAEVARQLGWAPEVDTWIVSALQTCFHERLVDFLEAMNDFYPELNIPGAEEDDQEPKTPHTSMRSSPPVRHQSPKRSREPDHISSAASVKRRRRLEGAEVPSTPDEDVGLSREFRQKHGISVSPSVLRTSTQTSQQLPILQQTPSRPRTRDTSPLRPLEMVGGTLEMGGRREQETSSDDEMPSLVDTLQRKGSAQTATARRRTLPASFSKPATQPPQSRRSTPPINTQLSPSQPLNSPTETASEWLTRHLRSGYPKRILDIALHHTTQTPGPSADHIVDSLANDNGIPADLPGVWLCHEDRTLEQLMATNLSEQANSALELAEQNRLREAQRRLIERHGWEAVKKRKRYLKEKEEAKRKRSAGGKPAVLTAEEKRRRQLELQRMMEEEEEEGEGEEEAS
ncbi:hypothetical protein NLU13_7707 [Sarocladium strictum]|uniref:DNA-binding protein RAP1 n=1 Tax=Sarocladium strictum TaxID=5046 RepID=A0AA39L5G2_SARSR|nr:hypothetical protein NLU13_7707 [Sarocladium strictum]